MKLFGALFVLASINSLAAASTCNPDNCARAVTGIQAGLAAQSSAKADCSSFLQATVYPATVTSTVTTTIYPFTATQTSISTTLEQTNTVYPFTETDFSTTTTFIQSTTDSTSVLVASTETDFTTIGTTTAQPQKRTITSDAPVGTVQPTSVPAYASACSGTVRYSSACSCFGVTETTITLPTPTTVTTTTITGTTTVTTEVATTSVAILSETTTFISLVGATTTEDLIETISITTTTTSSVLATSTAVANALCQNGNFVNGLLAPCTDPACQNYNLRIEGKTDTIYEGPIRSGPRSITTPSGGTHLCDGTNNGANPTPAGTSTTAVDSASGLCGFHYDGTYDSDFQDFFITNIGGDSETSTQFWGLLNSFQFTPVGGCQEEPAPTDEILWAYDAFNAASFLNVEPRTASVQLGDTVVFTITDGSTGNLIAGASFNGVVSDAQGQVVYTPNQVGTFRYKATRSDSIRSPTAIITVIE